MERPLPTVSILGTDFYVDVLREELRQKDKAANRIPFMAFDQEGDGYTFLYDKETCSIPDDIDALSLPSGRYEWVTLPAIMELDPVGIALKYDIPLEVLCPEVAAVQQFQEEEDDEEDGF